LKVLLGAWFTLPIMGRDSFSALMKQGVKYDKALGFKMDAETDLGSALRTIRSALGEDVELSLRCFVCGKEACTGCAYADVCDRGAVSPICLCAEHASGSGAFELYESTLRDTLVS
jgi:hypothetical protein